VSETQRRLLQTFWVVVEGRRGTHRSGIRNTETGRSLRKKKWVEEEERQLFRPSIILTIMEY